MKILKVQFKNINTLAGEWEIHFDRSPLREAGLFAITGPNGSGKSTILDAISLSLYGRTTRLEQPEKHVITKGMSDGYAKVAVSIDDNVYESAWFADRTNGSAKTRMVLTDLDRQNGTVKEGPRLVPSEIAEMTGLDFKRFSRSIMLAQGEFAAFLKSLESERAEILESIIGTEFYEETERKIRDRAASEAEKLQQLIEALDRLPNPSMDERDQILSEIDRLRSELDGALHVISVYEARRETLNQQLQLERRVKGLRDALQAAKSHRESLQPDVLRLEKAERAQELTDDLDRLQQLETDLNNTRQHLERAAEERAAAEHRLRNLIAIRDEASNALDKANGTWADRKEILDGALALQSKIAEHQQRADDLHSRESGLQYSRKQLLERQSQIDRLLEEKGKYLKELTAWLTEHDVDKGLDAIIPDIRRDLSLLASLKQQQSGLMQRKATAQEEENAAQSALGKVRRIHEKNEKSVSSLEGKKADTEEKMASYLDDESPQAIIDRYNQDKSRLSACNQMRKLSKAYQRGRERQGKGFLQELAEARSSTEVLLEEYKANNRMLSIFQHTLFPEGSAETREGETCPICGYSDCPVKSGDVTDLSDLTSMLRVHAADDKRRVKSRRAYQRQLSRMGRKAVKALELGSQWQRLTALTGTPVPISDALDIGEEIARLKSACRRQKRRVKKIDRLQRRIGKLGTMISRAGNRSESHLAAIGDLEERIRVCRDGVLTLVTEAESLERRKSTLEPRIADRLAPYDGSQLPLDDPDGLIARLEQMRDDFRSRAEEAVRIPEGEEALRDEAAGIPDALKPIEAELASIGEEITAAERAHEELLERKKQTYGSGDPSVERQALLDSIDSRKAALERASRDIDAENRLIEQNTSQLKTLEERVEQLRNEFEELSRSLEEKARAAGFENLLDAAENGLSPEEQTSIRDAVASADRKIEETEERLANVSSELDRLPSVSAPETGEEQRISSIKERTASIQSELSQLDRELKQLEADRTKYREKALALDMQQKACEKADGDLDYLESASAGEIKRWMQGFMLERLVDQSNHHLDALSGRYHLSRIPGRDRLALEIVDLKQSKKRRSLRTLSGGESFLVSISMALGLADLAAPKRAIQTLFIDEGFGRLDDEALYNVLSILKNLQSRGKMVGIISHIRQLADEIPTQVRLSLSADGHSQMEIVA